MEKVDIFYLNIWTCPYCKGAIKFSSNEVICQSTHCGKKFPIVSRIPVLLNEDKSVFCIDDFIRNKDTTFKKSSFKKKYNIVLPSISNNLSAERNLEKFKDLIFQKTNNAKPIILILGGGVITTGTQILISKDIYLIESDVSFAPRTKVIIDAHSIPLADCSVDGVILQAVLEHVIDPVRVISEVHRVLKYGGLIYASTPFMQQVHFRQYDFTRFTYLGHRRLLREFTEIESGAFAGSAVALAWSIKYFLLNFSDSKIIRRIITAFSSLCFFWLKYLDFLLKNKKGIYDSASGFYFLGKKEGKIISDKEILKLYKGAF